MALLVVGIGDSLGGPTGYAINPARDLGPRIAHAILPIKGKGGIGLGLLLGAGRRPPSSAAIIATLLFKAIGAADPDRRRQGRGLVMPPHSTVAHESRHHRPGESDE